jgi:hypothetical protein
MENTNETVVTLEKIAVKCQKCGYVTQTRRKTMYITCTNCHNSIKVLTLEEWKIQVNQTRVPTVTGEEREYLLQVKEQGDRNQG